ncbi:hypothetical protein GBAR_LOCUS28054, partial [Geodia barretti]
SDSKGSEELTLEDLSDIYTNCDDDSTEQPDNHLRMSFLALLCCFPCGIVALCSALKVNRLLSRGKLKDALKSSKKAELYSMRAFSCIMLFVVCQLLLLLSGLVLLICFAFDCIKTSCHW